MFDLVDCTPLHKAELRPYQITAVEDIENASGNVLFVLPTGGGKTIVAAQIIERTIARGERVLVLTHRREILAQTSHRLSYNNLDHGLIQAGLSVDLEYPIQIASIATFWSRCMLRNSLPLPKTDLIIIDESHHVRARTWAQILEAYPNARRLGMTARPAVAMAGGWATISIG
jgi:DNA repair protein RadD